MPLVLNLNLMGIQNQAALDRAQGDNLCAG